MNKAQRNKSRMSTTVETLLDDNQSKWEKIPAAARNVGKLKEMNAHIALLDTDKGEQDALDRSPKAVAKLKMVTLGYHLAQDALAFAEEKEDMKLKSQISFSFTELMYEGDRNSISRCELIAKAIEPIFDELKAEAGLADDELSNFTKAIASFIKENNAAGTNDSASVATNKALDDVFVELASFMSKKLNPSFARFERTDPEFFYAYENARSVKDLGVRHDAKGETPAVPAK